MRIVTAAVTAFFLATSVASAKEEYAHLQDYATRARDIITCTVKKDNGDGTVTAQVETVIKGDLAGSIVIRGETGICVIRGPVSRFMRPRERYLVFLFENQTVGRLGGILDIEKKTLMVRYMDGFTGTTFDEPTFTHKLPLRKAIPQIKAALKEEES